MRKFVIGDSFKDINEYCDYPYTHLFFRERLMHKAAIDNWMFHFLRRQLKDGHLKKAKLNDGFREYNVTIIVDGFRFKYRIIQTNEEEARKEAVIKHIKACGVYDEIRVEVTEIAD